MSTPHALLALTSVVALSSSVIVYRRTNSLTFELRALCAIAAAVACLLVFVLTAFALGGPAHDWQAARLAQSVAFARGYDLYYPETEGPLLSTIYGPISVLLYLPAAWLHDISQSFYAAGVLKFASLLIPMFVFFARANGTRRGLAATFCILTIGALAADASMVQILGTIHVDAPAVGLAMLSCACLIGLRPRPSQLQLALGASTAVLAAWTKQVDAPIVAGQFVWLWLAHGRAYAARYFVWCALCGAVITVAIGLVFGFEVTLFNVISVPGAHEFYPFGSILKEAVRMALPFLLILAWVVFRRREHVRLPLADTWGLLFLVAVFVFPTSMLGRAKLGGFLNSWHSQFFLICSAGVAVFLTVASASVPKTNRLVAVALALLPLPFFPFARSLRIYGRQGTPNRQEVALAFCEAHPGQVFFPWNPLVTLHSDGRLYHFEWAIRDRTIAGYAPTDDHIRSHLPEQLEYIVYPADRFARDSNEGRELIERLPEFSIRNDLPELPGYAVFTSDLAPESK